MKSVLSAVIGATLALSAVEAGAQATPGERQVSLTIESTSLATALDKWAQQSGFQIFVQDWEATKNLRAPSLNGTFAAQDALEQLLSGTSLTYVWIDSKTVSIRNKTAKTVPTALQRTSLDGQSVAAPVSTFAEDGFGYASAASGEGSGSESASAGTSQKYLQNRPGAVEEIIVTGTHISGAQNQTSRVVVLDRAYIDKSGYSSVRDIIGTLPQNFSGGVNESLGTTEADALNVNSGAAANLRGLGASATLVLVNGHRIASGGLDGAFVDISNIPSSAIERIEVLTDGASAIYGSDAIGGVVNLVLRKEFDGAETRVRFGTMGSGVNEDQVSQLLGTRWASGNILFGYQYYTRDALPMTERSFSANSDQRPRGGDNFSSPWSNPGNILNPFTLAPEFAIPSGQDGTNLTAGDLLPATVNYENAGEHNDLLADQSMHSAFVHLSQELGERVTTFLDGRFSQRKVELTAPAPSSPLFVPDSNPFFVDAYGLPFVMVGYDFNQDFVGEQSTGETTSYGTQLGVSFDLTSDWTLALSGSFSREDTDNDTPGLNLLAIDAALADPDPATAFNPFGDGSHTNPATLNSLRGTSRARAGTETWNVNALVDGTLVTLPSGHVKVALGADYREESFDLDFMTHEIGGIDTRRGLDRNVTAAFSELAIPLMDAGDSPGDIPRLLLSLAARAEKYSDFGDSVNPKVGLKWTPTSSLAARASWGTSFRAPRLGQLDGGSTSAIPFPVVDPQSPTGASMALLILGNNADLQEETARAWTVGLDFAPETVSNFRSSITYYDLDYTDRIARPGPLNFTSILLQEDDFEDLITRDPSQAQLDEFCNNPQYQIPPGTCEFAPPTVLIDLRLRNIAATRTRGFDLELSSAFELRQGTLGLGLGGTYVLNFEQTATAGAPSQDLVNTVGNPLKLRLRGTVSWELGGWGVIGTLNYANAYDDQLSQPVRDVSEWTTVDLLATYSTARGRDLLSNVTISLGALNVFDKDPPFVNQAVGFDPTNAQPYGRMVSVQLTKGWGDGSN